MPRRFRGEARIICLSLSLCGFQTFLLKSSETINLTLSSPANATLGTPNPATLTISDDDTIVSGDELYQYDLLGNIVFKTGVGAYGYSAAHPHAVITAGPFGFGYDANGNMTSVGGQITAYDAENRDRRRTVADH